ncbi:hypothetical protein [Mammaliicoccus lentus]|jgi:hypothetical protein
MAEVKHHFQNELVNRFLRAKSVALAIAQRRGVNNEKCNQNSNESKYNNK